MPPSKTSDKNLDFESTLQAVILADRFNGRFRTITLDRPRSKWSRSYSPIKIITIVTPEARSAGDALRKLDEK
ncbi:24086_t:CDS:2 [Cetraspora pellucida]|uniref:24086_t:CDS:1 n=1 Tax=Cetraspora pellucida TaxID=1433469 RepID=A0A9N9I8S4_9GLOM|nr:24086_t:CDS:2 [Cetraspora pellucida]